MAAATWSPLAPLYCWYARMRWSSHGRLARCRRSVPVTRSFRPAMSDPPEREVLPRDPYPVDFLLEHGERRHREAGLEAGQPVVRAVQGVLGDVVGDGHVRVVREAGLPGQRSGAHRRLQPLAL